MTQPVSLLPQIPGGFLPPASPASGLDDVERAWITGLSSKLSYQAAYMTLSQSYYDGKQRIADLGLSIPSQLSAVRTVVDWPRIVVDPLVMRAVVDGFRMPGQTDSDDELWGIWQANNLDAEAPLCFLDALTLGRGYMIVGSGDAPNDPPLITVESPMNLALTWDPRTRRVTAAYQSYEAEGTFYAALYLPDVTVQMSRDTTAQWSVDERDEHGFGEVPVVRFTNRQRSADREGKSEISDPIRNTTDSAVRTLLGMEIAREFYSVPHRYVLGAAESDFQAVDGTPKTAWDMVLNKFLALERDERGNIPTVGQFQAFDPSVYTKILDSHAQLMSSFTGYPPSYFGQTNTANPASADAIRSAQDGLNRRARQVNRQFSDPTEDVMRLSWRFLHDGAPVPAEMLRLETDWQPVEVSTPSATSDAMFKQSQMGAVPPTSDVVLSRLGYSTVERARLAQDRAKDAAASELADLANSLLVKEAKTDKSVIADLTAEGAAPPTEPAAPQPGPDQIVVPAHVRTKPGKSPGN